MTVIAPSILCETEEEYRRTVESIHPFAQRVHIDLTDGEFAPSFTVGVDKMWWPKEWQVDIHAMVTLPSRYVDQLIELRPYTVIFHAEASEDLSPSIQKLKSAGINAGVALLRPSVPADYQSYLEQADHATVFSGNLGFSNGEASMMQLEKVRLVRNIHPSIEIGWDGGANLSNIFSIAQANVDVVVCNSAINQSEDPAMAFKLLNEEINKRSVI